MRISIFGLGYAGSVGIGCLAKLGHQVTGVDINEAKVTFINQGKSPIIEKGIDDLRNSPIIDVLEKLLAKGFDIRIFDKNVRVSRLMGANRDYILQRIPLLSRFITSNADEVVRNSEVLVVVNPDKEFKKLCRTASPGTIIYDLQSICRRTKNRRAR